MDTINTLENLVLSSGFENYGDFIHPDTVEYPDQNQSYYINKNTGDVVEVIYNYYTGVIAKVDVYNQFKKTSSFILNS